MTNEFTVGDWVRGVPQPGGWVSIDVAEIRESDGRGRHTTTHRELHVSPSGASIIDTPGIRTVGLTDDVDLGSVFADIANYALQCKFKDCAHASEPGCAIRKALQNGTLSTDRWESYLKLGKEIAYHRRRADKALQSEEKKRWAKIQMANRQRIRGR